MRFPKLKPHHWEMIIVPILLLILLSIVLTFGGFQPADNDITEDAKVNE